MNIPMKILCGMVLGHGWITLAQNPYESPTNIEVTVGLMVFRPGELAQIQGYHPAMILTGEHLDGLRRKDKGTWIFQNVVTTLSGVNAETERGPKVTYPTEFGLKEMKVTGKDGQEATRLVAFPGGIEERVLGDTVNVTPTTHPVGTIILSLLPEQAHIHSWDDHGFTYFDETGTAQHVPYKLPVFFSHNLTTTITVIPETTHCLGYTYPDPEGNAVAWFVEARRPPATEIKPLEKP